MRLTRTSSDPIAEIGRTERRAPSAYELDKLFPAERCPADAELAQSRARGRARIPCRHRSARDSSEDRRYLTPLIVSRAGIAQADAERRVDEAIMGAATSSWRWPHRV